MKRENPIPNIKIKTVEELIELIKDNQTILIASIKNIPASQFQEIGKKLRGNAIIKVPKKNLILRALDKSKNQEVKKLKEQIKDSTAILFSNLDSFELAAELYKIKSSAKAKVGQEAPEDIEIQEGPTELVPGPAISELGALGIQIQIQEGKIHIKAPKVIVKKGEKISKNAADIMGKLDIKPFSIGFIPLSSLDTKNGKLYLEINIDQEGAIKELKKSYSKSLAFAVEIAYASSDTIKFLLAKALNHEKALEKFYKIEEEIAEPVEDKQEENKDEIPTENKEENK